MGEYHIYGGNKLYGEVNSSGAKNAVLPILASCVLCNGTNVITNVPNLSDTKVCIDILESLGCKVKYSDHTIEVDSSTINTTVVNEELVSKMRSSIIFLGGLLARFKECTIGYPGGCELGTRPIDLHLKGITSLGAIISDDDGNINAKAERLYGSTITLDFPSVGATENIMIAATLSEGETVILNAAREPEIKDLADFLNCMGANIKGASTSKIVIKGVKELTPTEYNVMPDRITTGTFLIATAISGGEVLFNDVNFDHIEPIVSKLKDTGCMIKKYDKDNKLLLKAPDKILPLKKVETHPHPGLPTDIQPQLMALLSVASGSSMVIETVFESRNKHIPELIKMGANITVSKDGQTFLINGVKGLHGSHVYARDLRGGAALIIAGLKASGKTIVCNSNFVERGYENIEETLKKLGADIILM